MSSVPLAPQVFREQAQKLIECIGVSRIVVVDDEYREWGVEDLIGLCSGLRPDQLARLPNLSGIDFSANLGVWSALVRDRWAALDSTERGRVLAETRMLGPSEIDGEDGDGDGSPQKEDLGAARSLEGIFAGLTGCEFNTLSLEQWQERRESFLEDERATGTVFLFDRDFSNEGGSPDAGIELVREMQDRAVGCCGLLSHTIHIDGERDAWRQIVDEFNLRRDKFVVIAKRRLTGNSSGYSDFLEMLRLVGLSGRYATLKSAAWSVFEESVVAAGDFVDSMSVFDFDKAVFRASRRDGVWEPETLFRMFAILMRREALKRLHQDEALVSDVAEARRISGCYDGLGGVVAVAESSPKAMHIQRFESYESQEELNRFHLPIDLGDIFERVSTRKRFILLVQPCDLIVRQGGKRTYETKYRRTGALVELADNRGERRDGWGELPFYHETTGESAFANYAKIHHVLLSILDLCVFRADGVAEINLDQDCPNVAVQPWRERYEGLRELYEKALRRCDMLADGQAGRELQELVFPKLSATAHVVGVANGRTVAYDLKRVARLRQPWSGALLTEFTQYQARAAFEADLDDG